jgi:very-short-patch-repair endonuclease
MQNNPLLKKKYIEGKAKSMKKKMTWPEREFAKMMGELGVKYETQKIINGKIFDFFIPSKNLVVEVDGNYYHGDENLYETLSPMQKRNKKNDLYKDMVAKGLGYNIERVWESELKDEYIKTKEKFKKILK